MIKKVLLFLIVFILAIPSFAMEIYQVQPVYDEQIEAQIQDLSLIIDKGLKEGDFVTLAKTCEEGYKRKKVGNPESIKKYNDMFLAFAIQTNLGAYELSREEKYAKKAYKLSKKAVEDKTTQLYAIQANILMASYKPILKQMSKAYDLFRANDLDKAMAFYPQYEALYNRGVEIQQQKIDARKQKIRNAVYITLLGVAAGCKGYSEGAANASRVYSTPTTYRATTSQVGNTSYTTIYGY
jgi:hypothetical protein